LNQILATSITNENSFAISLFFTKKTQKIAPIKLYLEMILQNKTNQTFLKELSAMNWHGILQINFSYAKISQLVLEAIILKEV